MNKKKYNKILGIIPARGGSKGIYKKNIKSLNNKPLIYYSIKAGLKSRYIDRLVVSTEDEEIAKISRKYNVEVIKRPIKFSRDDTPSITVYQHVIKYLKENENYEADIVVILQPTSPLRVVKDIDNCIEKLVNEHCDSVLTVKKVDHPIEWIVKVDKKGNITNLFNTKKITRRQDSEDYYIPNGAVFVTRSDIIMHKNTDRGPDTRVIIMPPERSVDIDTELDFCIAVQLMMKNE